MAVALTSRHPYKRQVKPCLCVLVASATGLAGCGFAHNVAVGSYRVVTAPVRLVHRQTDQPPVAATSDVTTPGIPVSPPTRPAVATGRTATTSASPRSSGTRKSTAQAMPSVSPRIEPEAQQFPTARPVPSKPGYVYSPSDPNKYVDVSGYAPGSKVKDPYSGKIFLVP